jgi:hypothetical protein
MLDLHQVSSTADEIDAGKPRPGLKKDAVPFG